MIPLPELSTVDLGSTLSDPKSLVGVGRLAGAMLGSVSKALGYVFEPSHVRRLARAKTDAKSYALIATAQAKATVRHIEANTERELRRASELTAEQRAISRLQRDELRGLENVEAIVAAAATLLEEAAATRAKARPIEDDWMMQFLRLSDSISDEQIRGIWARVLAGQSIERNSRISLATLDILRLLELPLAEAFRRCIQFNAVFGRCVDCWDQPDEALTLNLNDIHVQALNEIGFLQRVDTTSPTLPLRDFALGFFDRAGNPKSIPYSYMVPSWRGGELASIFFPDYLAVTSGMQEPNGEIGGTFMSLEAKRLLLAEWRQRFLNQCDQIRIGFMLPMTSEGGAADWVFSHEWLGSEWRQMPDLSERRLQAGSDKLGRRDFNRRLQQVRALVGDSAPSRPRRKNGRIDAC